MKEFRKNKDGYFICEECNNYFKTTYGLLHHISRIHKNKIEYFDKWIKEENDGKCIECGEKTFLEGGKYYKFCSSSCSSKYNLRKNGSPFSKKEIRNKSLKTLKKNYRNEYYLQTPEGKAFSKKMRKEMNDIIMSNIKKSNMEKYGVENVYQLNNVKEKIKQTCKEKYGVENISQLDSIKIKKQEKCFKTQIKLKKYKNTNIFYQASYELDFLDKYYPIYPDIENGPVIRYNFEGKTRIYFPDFYIPSLNLIIEIKNSWLAEKDKDKLKNKEIGVKEKGYKFLLLINKNYNDFK